jgi:acyl-CoA synthetase (NDP forming)
LEEILLLEKLIRPTNVAIVGASEKPGKFGYSAAQNLRKSRLEAVYYVNPRRETLFGQRCYPSLADLPQAVDCVLLCTPGHTVNPLLRQAGEQGIPSAVIFASGFGEEGTPAARAHEAELVEIAARYGMQVVGPNCLGVYNAVDDVYLWGMDSPHIPTSEITGIGVAAQSGWVVEMFVETDYSDIAYAFSTGNGSVVSLEECLDFLVDQEAVRVVALYLEGIRKPDVFLKALKKAAEKCKPVVILRGGRSAQGAASAASHTGNLTGSQEALESVFRKYGVMAVQDFDQLITMAHTFSILDGRLPQGPTYGGIALSGGENTLFTDIGVALGLQFPPFGEATRTLLREHIPPFATPHNPCDATTQLFFNEKAIAGAMQAVDADPAVGSTFVSVNIDQEEHPMWRHFCLAVAAAKKGCSKPVFAIPASEGGRNPALRSILEDAGIPLMGAPQTSLKCLRHLADFVCYRPGERSLLPAPGCGGLDHRETVTLSEAQSKREVAAWGIPFPSHRLIADPADLAAGLDGLTFPLVMKINSADIAHKTDAGGVVLAIGSAAEAASAFDQILENVRRRQPGARLEGVLVEEMAPPGLEIIIGVANDGQLGPMLMVGLGGVFVEVFKDIALYPIPLNRTEALEMLKGLQAYQIMAGYRGTEPYDVEALAELMVKVSEYAFRNRDSLKELDLNPVFVYPQGGGAVAVDALIVKFAPQA